MLTNIIKTFLIQNVTFCEVSTPLIYVYFLFSKWQFSHQFYIEILYFHWLHNKEQNKEKVDAVDRLLKRHMQRAEINTYRKVIFSWTAQYCTLWTPKNARSHDRSMFPCGPLSAKIAQRSFVQRESVLLEGHYVACYVFVIGGQSKRKQNIKLFSIWLFNVGASSFENLYEGLVILIKLELRWVTIRRLLRDA